MNAPVSTPAPSPHATDPREPREQVPLEPTARWFSRTPSLSTVLILGVSPWLLATLTTITSAVVDAASMDQYGSVVSLPLALGAFIMTLAGPVLLTGMNVASFKAAIQVRSRATAAKARTCATLAIIGFGAVYGVLLILIVPEIWAIASGNRPSILFKLPHLVSLSVVPAWSLVTSILASRAHAAQSPQSRDIVGDQTQRANRRRDTWLTLAQTSSLTTFAINTALLTVAALCAAWIGFVVLGMASSPRRSDSIGEGVMVLTAIAATVLLLGSLVIAGSLFALSTLTSAPALRYARTIVHTSPHAQARRLSQLSLRTHRIMLGAATVALGSATLVAIASVGGLVYLFQKGAKEPSHLYVSIAGIIGENTQAWSTAYIVIVIVLCVITACGIIIAHPLPSLNSLLISRARTAHERGHTTHAGAPAMPAIPAVAHR